METKTEPKKTVIPADFLANVEFLPDGTATVNQQLWLKSWAEVAQLQVSQGKIKLHEVKEYDPDTGQVPNEFIKQFYLKQRKAH